MTPMMAQTTDSLAILETLNSTQAEAVQAIEGPVLVLAGPGSGKTRVLTHRIAYLVRVCGVRPYNILAVTFTNKAAKEMISRLQELIGDDASRLTVGTFHAICARILRREGAYLGLSSSFVIYDEDDQQRLVTRILKELNLDDKLYRPAAVHAAISRAKNELITAETYQPPSYWHEAVARAFARYEELKAENNALDFDDLLLKAEELFRLHPEVREQYQKRYQFILVDEFQDTNKAQYELISHLAGGNRGTSLWWATRTRASTVGGARTIRNVLALSRRLSRCQGLFAGAQLSLHADRPRCRPGRHRPQHPARAQEPVDRDQGRPAHPRFRGLR